MSSKGALRLKREYDNICAKPVPEFIVKPDSKDLFTWYFILKGSPETVYEGGVYAGKILFPPEYPFKAPDFMMLTPNGRFKINERICLTFTGYHQETWSPMWSVATMLQGLISFMNINDPTVGAETCTDDERKRLAANSLEFTKKISIISELFPEL
jgi:ubiquitin-protein ligase